MANRCSAFFIQAQSPLDHRRKTRAQYPAAHKKILSSEKGVSLIITLSVMPFLSAVFLVLISIYQVILWHNKSHYLCRQQLLADQEQIRVSYQRLRALNVKATALRLQARMAYARLALATASQQATAIAAALKHLYRVKTRQKKFRKKQDLAVAQIKRVIAVLNRSSSHILKSRMGRPIEHKKMHYTYNLKPVPKSSITPNFEATDYFTRRQRAQYSWKIPVLKLLPQWIQSSTFWQKQYENLFLQGSCSASISKEGLTWSSSLTPVKP